MLARPTTVCRAGPSVQTPMQATAACVGVAIEAMECASPEGVPVRHCIVKQLSGVLARPGTCRVGL